MARQKEDLSSLPKKWYNDVLKLYKEGGADVEVFAMIYEWRGTFSNDLWERWMKEESEFSETIKMGRQLAQAWWVRNGRTNIKDKEFNYTGWYMQMKNRYGWADKQEVKQANTHVDIPLSKWVNNTDKGAESMDNFGKE